MQIVRELAGYTLGRSDNVRRAMSKKKQEVMEYEREIFVGGNEDEVEKARAAGKPQDQWPKAVPGCVNKGIDRRVAEGVYDMMIDFAKYGFNKSHAACYAVVAYQTAWLKVYYPKEYMAALMTSVIQFSGKVAAYNQIARQMGLKLMPPDINKGDVGFAVSEDGILYALTAIKGVGHSVIGQIVEEREKHGLYKDLNDFVERMAGLDINKRAVENMIKAGAFDSFGYSRKALMGVYQQMMDQAQKNLKQSMSGQMSLFDIAGEEDKESFRIKMPVNVGEYPREMLLGFEKEMLGIYVSGHPLEEYSGLWDKIITNSTADLMLNVSDDGQAVDEMNVEDNEKITLGGMVENVNVKFTKKGDAMAFVTLEDVVGQAEVIMFPKTYKQFSRLLTEGNKIMVSGRVSLEEDKDGKLICDAVYNFDDIPRTLWLQFKDAAQKDELWDKIYGYMESSDGLDGVKLYYTDSKKVEELPHNISVHAGLELREALKQLLGEENVRVTYRMPGIKRY